MDIFTALETRRSIRHYTGEPIDESKIIEAIKYAMYAPSAHNSRSWRFILTSKKNIYYNYQKYILMLKCCQKPHGLFFFVMI